ncbi:cation:proton antiporter [Rhizomonospora bruguierae]|uniref:cation:proton antiporter n=1 Tax=Rhizomonospora bruguierae TaxID=1581705 RepID=UPI0020BFC1DB|nr:cation:proton antiporter [Micromonospora sp. NBRC 107566]
MPVAPISAHPLLTFLLQVGLLLLLALCFGRLATRMGLPAVVGELLVGVLLGPSLLAHVAPAVSGWLFPAGAEQFHLLDAVGQLGVLLLVGVAGMQMDVDMIRRRGVAAAGISAGGLAIPFGLGIALGFALSGSLMPADTDPLVFALFMAVAMGVSAIPVIAKILLDMRMVHRNIGQLVLTAGMVDDAFGWVMLSIVSALATTGLHPGDVVTSVVSVVAVVTVAVTVGRPLARAGFRLAGRGTDPAPTVALATTMIVLAAVTTHALGLEAVFGAFVCGILIGSVIGPDHARLAPLRTVVVSVLAPIFFATAGLRMDLTSLWHPRVLAAGLLVLAVAILGKFAGAYLGARLSRFSHWEGLALGAGLNARGVIEVVVAMAGLRLGILTVQAYTIVILVAIVTSLMAPPVLRLAMARIEQTAEEDLRERTHLPTIDQRLPT